MHSSDKIALLGTGLMGGPMAGRIAKAGYPLTVWNRTAEKSVELKTHGATVSKTPAEAVLRAGCIVLMLTDHAAIEEVLFSADTAASLPGKTFLQMGTIAPAQSVSLEQKLAKRGADYFEAPVLGSIPEAAAGKLLVMVGGQKRLFDRWSGLLECFGTEPIFIGEAGQAAALKLAMNQLIAGLTASFSLSLALVQKSGVAADRFMDILRKSALYAPTFDKKLSKMLEGDFSNPNFPAKHLAKDVGLFIEAAGPLNLDTAGIEGVRKIVEKTVEAGLGEDDYSAIFEIIRSKVR